MSDPKVKKSEISGTNTDPRDQISEEVFAWVVSDEGTLAPTERDGSHVRPDELPEHQSGPLERQLLVSAPALARRIGGGGATSTPKVVF